ncbi:MAG: DNA (cytosine-5-)-methyltransferase [Verrucomicrobiota bacterium]
MTNPTANQDKGKLASKCCREKTNLSAVSLFSGCGGSDLGLRAAGIETLWANDSSESACELYEVVTAKGVINPGNVEGIKKFPKADILAGCYPCQGYSQAGRRTESDRINYLYQHFDRALRQVRPLAFIVENVDGMRFSHNEHLLKNQLVRFRLAGYRVAWRVLNARDYGLAQNRSRLFIVGIRSSEGKAFKFPKPTHGTTEMPYRTMRDVIWNLRDAPVGSYNEEPFHWYYLSRNRRHEWDEQAPCVVAHWRHVGLHPDSTPLVKISTDCWEFAQKGFARRFSYLECAALQGFPKPKAFRRCTVEKRFRAIGNAVPPPLFEAVACALSSQLRVSQQ